MRTVRPAVSSTTTSAGTESSVAATKVRSVASARSVRMAGALGLFLGTDAVVELQAGHGLAAKDFKQGEVLLD